MYRNRKPKKDTSTEGMASLQGSVALTRILRGLLKHSSQYWREKLKLEDGARPSCRRQYKNHKRHLGLSEMEREKLNETVGGKFNSFQFWTVKFTVFLGHIQNIFFLEYLDCPEVQSAGPCNYQNVHLSAVSPLSLIRDLQMSVNDSVHSLS